MQQLRFETLSRKNFKNYQNKILSRFFYGITAITRKKTLFTPVLPYFWRTKKRKKRTSRRTRKRTGRTLLE
jgi:hypothetical protein